jgi:hypothetical protein
MNDPELSAGTSFAYRAATRRFVCEDSDAALAAGNSRGQVTAFRFIAQTTRGQFVPNSAFAATEAISDQIGHKLEKRGRPDE